MINRNLSTSVLSALQEFPVVYVNGPRQAGKSTLVRKLAAEQWPAEYVTFDEATVLGAAEANPESFLRAFQGSLILDEVQMVPGLFRALKILVDEGRLSGNGEVNGRYLLTGSANVLALPGLSDALVGRMSVLTLYPFSAVEVVSRQPGGGSFFQRLFTNTFKPGTCKGDVSLLDVISRATFPEISERESSMRGRWFEAYITTILQRDVRQLADIAKLGVLPNLLRVMAARAGGLINESDIARSIRQNAVTSKNYRVLLEMLFLTFEVKPWFRNLGKRLVKSAKSYLVDTSLLCYLQQIDLKHTANSNPQTFGYLLENFVATELLKQLAFTENRANLYHFRTSDGKEVDFLLEQANGKLAGIEVKGRDTVSEKDFNGLKFLRQHTGKDFVCGIVLYRGNRIVPFSENLWAIPVTALWS